MSVAMSDPQTPRTASPETEFFSDPNTGVRVTSARFIPAPNKTYAMAGITSVTLGVWRGCRWFPILLICLLSIWAVQSPQAEPIPLFFVALCGFWLYGARARYSVRLFSASGQSEDLQSRDRQYVARVIDAINQAIVFRDR